MLSGLFNSKEIDNYFEIKMGKLENVKDFKFSIAGKYDPAPKFDPWPE